MASVELEIDGLRRRYGSVVALDGLSFDVPSGQVFGFLGPNGAGKTTTMRAIFGEVEAVRPEGTVLISLTTGADSQRILDLARVAGPIAEAGRLAGVKTVAVPHGS